MVKFFRERGNMDRYTAFKVGRPRGELVVCNELTK